jgi:transposase
MKASPPIHLEIQRHRKSHYGVLRSSYRDPESGKVKHRQYGRITGQSLERLRLIQASFRGEVCPIGDKKSLKITDSKEYGASAALLALAKDIGLDTMLYSKPHVSWVKDVLAMVVGRIVFQGSKRSLSKVTSESALWELSGVTGTVDVNKHCYESMDCLIKRQKAIQTSLAKKHISNGALVLYDITSTYFEGAYETSELVDFGHNRDKKRGHEQIVIGLLTDARGCPVAVEVFPGNTNDASTMDSKVREVRERYGIKEVVMVGDRGMITKSVEKKMADIAPTDQLRIISALKHSEVEDLLARTGQQPELFDEHAVIEIWDKNEPGKRFCLCRNPLNAARETKTRNELLGIAIKKLTHIAQRKNKTKPELIGSQVERVFIRTKMRDFIKWDVDEGRLIWHVKEDEVAKAQALDGCYVIKTTVPQEIMSSQEVVSAYKSLGGVEQAFRHMKTVSLEMRPVYHKTDERIKAHVFICMLAYYLLWHFIDRLRPLLGPKGSKKKSKTGSNKPSEFTVRSLLNKLKKICQNEVEMGEIKFRMNTKCNEQQETILKHLGVKI